MRYTLRLSPETEAFIRHLHPLIKVKIRRALEDIEANPDRGKPLKEPLTGFYSFRVTRYRIIYQIKRKEVLIQVVEIAERAVVYQKVANALRGFLEPR